MKLIIYDDDKRLLPEQADILKNTANTALEGFGECLVELSVIDEAEMTALNLEARGINGVTDVLSFPYMEFDENRQPKPLDPALDYIDNKPYLGEVMVCYDKAELQAKQYGHTLNRELAFLTAHAMLHLIGYDHKTPEDERVMTDIQEGVLQKAGIPRATSKNPC